MIMIPGSGTVTNYGSYTRNCQAGQMPYKIPVNSLSDIQLYIAIGNTKPTTVLYQLIHTCGPTGGTVETIVPADYVVAQDTNGQWYGVFKNFASTSAQCFVIAITLDSDIYFSDEYCIEPNCETLTLLQGCYGNMDNDLSYDCEDIYFGIGQGDALGDTAVTYKHQLYLRQVDVSLGAIKNTFKQGRTRNFRTEKDKIYNFFAEFIPEWYLPEVDAVFYRGEVYVDDTRYLVNDTAFEKIEPCKKIWKPTASFKESCFKSFTCETDPCSPPITTCCDPAFISVIVEEVPYESGFTPGSGEIPPGTFSGIVVIQGVIGGTIQVTGTGAAITGLTNNSTVISSSAFDNVRVYIERGAIPVYEVDDGSGNYYTKNLTDDFITLSTPIYDGDFIYIQTIP